MKIAIISTMRGYSWAGTEEVWFHFAKLAMEEGHEIMVGADHRVVDSEHVKELQELGLKTARRRVFRPMRLFLLKQRISPDMAVIRKFAPDLVLINAGSPLDHIYSGYIWEFCRKLNRPMVFFCHFNSDRLKIPNREALLASLKEMAGLVFVSHDNQRVLERQVGTHLPNSAVIVNGPRFKLCHPIAWPGGIPRFAHVARLETEWKGHDVLLETLSSKTWRSREWELTLFGNGPDEDYIRRLIGHYDLVEKVKLAGYVRNVPAIFENHHILLLPSRGEGTPLVALEAMMCGRPVITTDVGGNSEILDEGISGFIAEAPTSISFGRAMERAWTVRNDWELLGQHAHERALQLEKADPPRQLLDYLSAIHDD